MRGLALMRSASEVRDDQLLIDARLARELLDALGLKRVNGGGTGRWDRAVGPGGGTGDLGGGRLEQPRQWPGAQCGAGFPLWEC